MIASAREIREVEVLAKISGLKREAPAELAPPGAAASLPITVKNRPDLGKDVVEYDVSNSGMVGKFFVLYRGVQGLAPAYFFGNAFFAVYLGDIQGQGPTAYWLGVEDSPTNLPENPNSSYALGVLKTASAQGLVCFLFYVLPGATMRFLEGGIPDASRLTHLTAFVVAPSMGELCVHYSQGAVSQYESQTGYSVTNVPTDPSTIVTLLATPAATSYPTNEIIQGQYAAKGPCR